MRFYNKGHYAKARERLSPDLVRRVQANDRDAIMELLDIFEAKIRKYASIRLYDRMGNPVIVQDQDYTSHLEEKLVRAFKTLGLSVPTVGKRDRCNHNKGKAKSHKCKKPCRNDKCQFARRKPSRPLHWQR